LTLPEPEQAAFLSQSCADDPVLQALVERLLARAMADDPRLLPGAGLEMLGVETDDFAAHALSHFEPGERVGAYRLERVLGRGGMATVYLAARADGQFEQTVALKILDRAGESLARFEQERQILASLDHPNTARLLDGGITGRGVPYVAMEYVEGVPLLEYCDRERLGIEQRLKLFNRIVDAVHDAHRKLIVHRDIKSANILVTSTGVPKLLDFGIAKLLETGALPNAAPQTRALTPMTPEYASPEQIRNEPMSVATDIYQLGYLLYVLLTGQSPYAIDYSDMVALVDAITRRDPVAPGRRVSDFAEQGNAVGGTPWARRNTTRARLQRRLRGDLDRVVLKALHKDPDHRYASAAALAADIDNVLADRPVSARPDSVRYRTRKFIKRNAVAVGATSVAVIAVIVGTALFTYRLSQAKQEAELEAEKSAQVTEFLTGLFEANDPSESLGDSISARQLLDRGAEQAEALQARPELQAQMFDVLGRMYRKLGRYEQAKPLLDRAVAIRREANAQPDAALAESLSNLGELMLDEADYSAAEELFREALAIQRSLLDEQDPEIAELLNDLGNVASDRGDFEDAERYHREGLAIRRTAYGDEHPDVATSLNNLGLLLWRTGDYDEAEAMHRQALAIRRRLFGDVHPDITYSLNNLALVLQSRGDYDAAEPLYRELLAMDRKLLGDEHPEVAMDLNNLGGLLSNKRNYTEAAEMHRQALALRRKLLPLDHPHTAQSLHNLGTVHYYQGEFDEAERTYREALSIRRTALGDEHPAVASTLDSLGALLVKREKYDAAETSLRESLAIRRKVLGERHPHTAHTLRNLASTYYRRGDAVAAEPLHREALAIQLAALGDAHWVTAMYQVDLGASLTALSRYEEAEALLLEASAALELTDNSEEIENARQKLVALYEAWDRPEEAARYRELP
jgi:serine/threonine-protein kinase